jgi:hypothetical protein
MIKDRTVKLPLYFDNPDGGVCHSASYYLESMEVGESVDLWEAIPMNDGEQFWCVEHQEPGIDEDSTCGPDNCFEYDQADIPDRIQGRCDCKHFNPVVHTWGHQVTIVKQD